MNKVLIIGPSFRSIFVKAKDYLPLFKSNIFSSEVFSFDAGGCYAIGYDCVALDVTTYLVTRLAFDDHGSLMLNEFNKANGILYSCNKTIPRTPYKVVIEEKEKTSIYNDIDYDCYPDNDDYLPPAIFSNEDYGLINIINMTFMNKLINKYKNIRWVVLDNVPSNQFLPFIDGIIFNQFDLLNKIVEDKAQYYIQQLLDRGVKWAIVYNSDLSVELYDDTGKHVYRKEECGKFTFGGYEAFVSMLLACLTNQLSFEEAIDHGLTLANNFSNHNEMVIKKEFFN